MALLLLRYQQRVLRVLTLLYPAQWDITMTKSTSQTNSSAFAGIQPDYGLVVKAMHPDSKAEFLVQGVKASTAQGQTP